MKSIVRRTGASIAALLIIGFSSGVNAQDAATENSANGSTVTETPASDPTATEGSASDPAATENAVNGPYWKVQVAPFALHWSRNSEHKNVYLLGVEHSWPEAPSWTAADETFWGLSVFRNSFGQTSAYAYLGYRWTSLFGHPPLFLSLSGGLLYGYKKPYENKVPFNHNGFSPGLIPAIGYRLTPHDAVQVGALGAAGLIFMYDRRF